MTAPDRETLAAALEEFRRGADVCYRHLLPQLRRDCHYCIADALLAGPLAPGPVPEGGVPAGEAVERVRAWLDEGALVSNDDLRGLLAVVDRLTAERGEHRGG